jgi:fructokinase
MARYAGIEAGGTTWVVAIAEGEPSNIVERAEFETTTPIEVLSKVIQISYRPWSTPADTAHQVIEWLKVREFDSLGIASFGPIELHENSQHYGFITTTPKPGPR